MEAVFTARTNIFIVCRRGFPSLPIVNSDVDSEPVTASELVFLSHPAFLVCYFVILAIHQIQGGVA